VFLVVLLAVVAVAGVLLLRRGHAEQAYGGLPSWLPKARVAVGRVVVATPSRPAHAIEGDTVHVRLAHGTAHVTAVGPSVPEEGHFPIPPTSPCTFTVSFEHASGAVRLRAGDFTALDEHGALHRLKVTLLGGRPLPSRLPANRPLDLVLRGVLPTGGGALQWSPQGRAPVASWDYDVEID
jgi:hypothetical protein